MNLPYYVVNAFTSEPFRGNPAGVCLLDEWLPDAILQKIAHWNRLSETAFLVKKKGAYKIRWFTPEVEMDLCGHATLATGYMLRELGLAQAGDTIALKTETVGELEILLGKDEVTLNFPATPANPGKINISKLAEALGAQPDEVLQSRDTLAVFGSADAIRNLEPDFAKIARLETFAIIATAPGEEVDFVSRFFAPGAGVDEDPVTGSAHCTSTPYWADRLGKMRLTARQISSSPGDLVCELKGDRVHISGHCSLYATGQITI